jgi:hypothetical protein
VFQQALTMVMRLPQAEQQCMLARLDEVRSALNHIGWGVSDDIDACWRDRVPGGES